MWSRWVLGRVWSIFVGRHAVINVFFYVVDEESMNYMALLCQHEPPS